jgi:hypothetical protein
VRLKNMQRRSGLKVSAGQMKMVDVVYGGRVSVHTLSHEIHEFSTNLCIEVTNFNSKYWQTLRTCSTLSNRNFRLPKKEFSLKALNKPGSKGYTKIIAHTSELSGSGWQLPIDNPHHLLQLPLGKYGPSREIIVKQSTY